jgi:hypothetical protein
MITLMMEAAKSSETLVIFHQTTQCYNPEDSHLSIGGNSTCDRHQQDLQSAVCTEVQINWQCENKRCGGKAQVSTHAE